MGKSKPTSITTIKDCEAALEWIDRELVKLDKSIRITSMAIFSPKRWTTALTGWLWSKQVTQDGDNVCNSPFLAKLESSARSDESLNLIELSNVTSTAKEVRSVCSEKCNGIELSIKKATAAANESISVDDKNTESLDEAEREAIRQHDSAVEVGKRKALIAHYENELAEWNAMLGRAERMVDRANDALDARRAFIRTNYQQQSESHLKWAARSKNLQPPFNLTGVLGTDSQKSETKER